MSPALTSLVSSWASTYADSAGLRTAIGFAHIGGLLIAGGAALTADRAVLYATGSRADRALRERQVADLGATHRVVLTGLASVFASGLLLAAADVETYAASATFWIKMAAVGLLTINGGVLVLTGRRIATDDLRRWRVLRASAAISLTLWLLTTLLGAALPNVG